MRWHTRTVEETAEYFGTDPVRGKKYAAVNPEPVKSNGLFLINTAEKKDAFFSVVSDAVLPLFIITLLIYAVTGAYIESVLILIVMLLSYTLSSVLKYRSMKMGEMLSERLIPSARRVVDGEDVFCDPGLLTPGDLIRVEAGDVVPTDARLVWSDALKVLETRTDARSGKSTGGIVAKKAETVYNEKQDEETYENMIYAGSVVTSGRARALVVAAGGDTRAAVSGNGVRVLSGCRSPEYHTSFLKRAGMFSVIILICVLPLVLYDILAVKNDPSAGKNVMTFFLTALALAAVSFGAQTLSLTSLLFTFPRSREKTIRRSEFTDSMASADTLVIMSEELLYDRQPKVRCVYFNGREYPEDRILTDVLRPLARRALILDHAFKQAGYEASSGFRTGKSFYAFAEELGIDRSEILTGSIERNSSDYSPAENRSSVLVRVANQRGSAESRLFRSIRFSAVSECVLYRTEGGQMLPMDPPARERASAAYVHMIENGLTPVIVFSTDPHSRRTVFDGMLGIGGSVPEWNGDAYDELQRYGVRPVLILPADTPRNRRFAEQCGIAQSRSEIAIAGVNAPEAGRLYDLDDDSFLKYNVFIGFGSQGDNEIIRRLVSGGAAVLPVIRDIPQLINVKKLRRSIGTDETNVCGAVAEIRGSSQQSVALDSACELTAAKISDRTSGLRSALKAMKEASACTIRLFNLRNYLIFSVSMRICAILLPLFLHMTDCIPGIAQIFAAGFFPDICAILTVCADRIEPKSINAAAGLFSTVSVRAELIKYVTAGLLSGISIPVCESILFGSASSGASGAMFVFSALVLSELTALGSIRSFSRKKFGIKGINIFFLVCTAGAVALLAILDYFPLMHGNIHESYGIGACDWMALLGALLPALISAVLAGIFEIARAATAFYSDKE